MTDIEREVAKIIESGVLGRSATYIHLLQYLSDATTRNTSPKEIEIAIEVFRRTDFDPSNDSMVRVYIHKLRQKLDAFYKDGQHDSGTRLAIPKGEYRLVLSTTTSAPPTESKINPISTTKPLLPRAVLGMLMLLLLAAAFLAGRNLPTPEPLDAIANKPPWQSLLDDELPVRIIVGDYYLFAESDKYGSIQRLVRDFNINSARDLETYTQLNPEMADSVSDVQLTYLPSGIASALSDLVKILHNNNKRIAITLQSQLQAPMIRNSHIMYIGYLSSMGKLTDYVFAASRLSVGATFDELIDLQTGETFVSGAGLISRDDTLYSDYGFISSFPGPANNHILVVAGTRDEGLMQMATTLVNPESIANLTSKLSTGTEKSGPAFEALYRVSSQDRAYVASKNVFVSTLETDKIWQDPYR